MGLLLLLNEVRNLAEHSRASATEISDLANASVDVSNNAMETLNEMVPNIKETASLVQEISISSSEQTMSVEQINQAIHNLDTIAQSNAAQSNDLELVSNTLSEEYQNIVENLKKFKCAS